MAVANDTRRREEKCLQGLIGNPEANRQLRRPRNKRKYDIKKDLKEVGREGVH